MDWNILLLHSKRETLLKTALEAAFPGKVISLFRPGLNDPWMSECPTTNEVWKYFRTRVFNPSIWSRRVLTIYGSGSLHHYTHSLTRLSTERRGFDPEKLEWTYAHFDNHRDTWLDHSRGGNSINCGGFVDLIARDHGGVPFLIGTDVYPRKDIKGYSFSGRKIPIFSNYFSSKIKRKFPWHTYRGPGLRSFTYATQLPSEEDLLLTPRPSYLSFDLDVLRSTELVSDFDHHHYMTLRRLCQIVDKVRGYKSIFGADILGMPDNCYHPLSALTVVILAKKILGGGIKNLLSFHTHAKRVQAPLIRQYKNIYKFEDDHERPSPITESQLLEVLKANALS